MAGNVGQSGMLELLNESRMRPIHYRLWLLSTGGTLFDGFSVFMLGVTLPLIIPKFHISPTVTGLIGSALVVGAVAGAAIGGPAADRLGRKTLYLIDMALLTAAAALSAMAWQATSILAFQFLIGVALGIDFPVSASYVSEFMPRGKRGRMMVATITFQAVGMVVAAILALIILRVVHNELVWRYFYACLAIFAALFFLLRLWLPESARWYMSKGRNDKAAEVIASILPEKRPTIEKLLAEAGSETHYVAKIPPGGKPLGMWVLFTPSYLRRTILAAGPWFLMDIATYGVGLFTPMILGAMHLSDRVSKSAGVMGIVDADLALARGSGIMDAFLLVGFLIGLYAVPRFGKMRMQLTGFIGMTVGMLILAAATLLFGGASHHVPLVFAGFILFNLLMNMGPNSTTFTLPAELFPTHVRASGSGFAAASGKVGATVGIFFLPLVKDAFGVTAVLCMVAVVSAFGFILTLAFREETGEASLEELHEATTS